jgi:protease-4
MLKAPLHARLLGGLAVALMLTPSAHAQFDFLLGGDKPATVQKATSPVRVFRLSGIIRETLSPWSLFSAPNTLIMSELLATIEVESKAPQVEALIFKLQGLELGLSQAEELAGALTAARKQGKQVIAHLESATLPTLAAVATATEIHLTPEGSVMLPGLQAEISFYRDLLGTLGVEADIEAVGQYKSAMEPFTRSTLSDPARENLEALVDGLYASSIDLLALPRKLTPAKLKALIDEGLLTAEDAKATGLVDRLAYWDETLAPLNPKGDSTRVSLAWPKAKEAPEIGSLFDLFSLLTAPEDDKADKAPKVAVIVAEGTIVEGRSMSDPMSDETVIATEDLLDTLHEIERDDSVKAIVLRIDSPGGSALASDILWRELARLNEKKPIVASMGNTAASGGYYLASAARRILANPTTLTGSIGVFGGKMVYASLLDKIDVDTVVISRGKHAGMFSGLTRFSDTEREVMRKHMKHTYKTFVNRVAKGRNMSHDAVDRIAQGRVYTGRQASEVGLVDKLGGLDDAIAEARKLARLPADTKSELYPKPKTFLEMLDLFGGGTGSRRITAPRISALHALLQSLPAPLSTHARRLLTEVVPMLEREKALTLLPFAITIR